MVLETPATTRWWSGLVDLPFLARSRMATLSTDLRTNSIRMTKRQPRYDRARQARRPGYYAARHIGWHLASVLTYDRIFSSAVPRIGVHNRLACARPAQHVSVFPGGVQRKA